MLNETARTRTLAAAATLAAGATLAAAATGGCTKSSDPNAAPYGIAASPSTNPASAVASPVSVAAVASAAPPVTTSPTTPTTAASGGQVAPDASPASPPMAGGPMTGGGPMMGMGGSPTAPLSPTPELDKKIADAEKSGKKSDIAAAYAERGTFREFDEKAGARVKYRAALQDFRKALVADPTNAEAKKNKDQIEGIYKQMGRPIPE